jgi:hypothetical protein
MWSYTRYVTEMCDSLITGQVLAHAQCESGAGRFHWLPENLPWRVVFVERPTSIGDFYLLFFFSELFFLSLCQNSRHFKTFPQLCPNSRHYQTSGNDIWKFPTISDCVQTLFINIAVCWCFFCFCFFLLEDLSAINLVFQSTL